MTDLISRADAIAKFKNAKCYGITTHDISGWNGAFNRGINLLQDLPTQPTPDISGVIEKLRAAPIYGQVNNTMGGIRAGALVCLEEVIELLRASTSAEGK